jgi:putative tricarboxylic transport membrane protein
MILLLSLCVLGGAVTAVLLGAFIIQGLEPEPMLYREHIDIVYQLFAQVVMVNRDILTPSIFVLSMVGAFAMRSNIFDVYTTLAFGILGYIMMRYDYPLSPILLP